MNELTPCLGAAVVAPGPARATDRGPEDSGPAGRVAVFGDPVTGGR